MADPISLTMLAVTAVSAGAGAFSAYQSGMAQKYEYQQQARQEKMAARDKQIERNNRLLSALSKRNVAAAVSGGGLDGSNMALVNRDLREYNLESLAAGANSASTQAGLAAAGKSAQRAGAIKAGSSLIKMGGSLFGSLAGPKPGKK